MNRHDELTLKLLDQTVSDSELQELMDLVQSPEVQKAMCQFIELESLLQSSGRLSIANEVIERIEQERRVRIEDSVMRVVGGDQPTAEIQMEKSKREGTSRIAFLAGGLVALATCFLVAWFGLQPATNVHDVVAQLDSRGALVRIVHADGTKRSVGQSGRLIQLRANETVETSNAFDTAEIVYADGTKVELLGQTSVMVSTASNDSKRLSVLSGLIQADVVPQPNGRPMQIITQAATLDAPEANLGVEVRNRSTQMGVATGRAAMTRMVDGQRVEVEAGRYATATESSQELLQSRPFPVLPSQWSEDFEHGLPEGWIAGQWTTIQGVDAVQEVRSSRTDQRRFSLTSQNAWQEGQHALCSIDDGSILHLRIRQDSFARITIMVGARAYPPAAGRSGVNLFYTKRAWNENLAAGQWRTISVPLKDIGWYVTQGNRANGSIELDGLATYLIHVSTMDQDVGLMIDRIWMTHESEENSF